MTIRMIARELYRLQQEVVRLEAALDAALQAKRPAIEAQLRKARKEKNYVQGALDGCIGRKGGRG